MFKIITLPFYEGRKCFLEEEFNKFILNKIVRTYQAQFFVNAAGAF